MFCQSTASQNIDIKFNTGQIVAFWAITTFTYILFIYYYVQDMYQDA